MTTPPSIPLSTQIAAPLPAPASLHRALAQRTARRRAVRRAGTVAAVLLAVGLTLLAARPARLPSGPLAGNTTPFPPSRDGSQSEPVRSDAAPTPPPAGPSPWRIVRASDPAPDLPGPRFRRIGVDEAADALAEADQPPAGLMIRRGEVSLVVTAGEPRTAD